MAGVAGAHLSVAVAPSWVEGMVSGRGWVAIALVVFAAWDPVRSMGGAYLFGGAEALVFRLQSAGATVSPFLLLTLPYILTIGVLVLASFQRLKNRIRPPNALAIPYEREST